MFDVAGAVERENLRSYPIQEKAVVTDRDDRSFKRVERFFQRFARRNVEMICRLVEHQNVYARINQLGQRESSLLSAGKIAHVFVNVIADKQKLCQKRSQLACRRIRGSDAAQFHDDLVAVVEVLELLRVIAKLNLRAPAQLARQRWNLAEHGAHKSGFARSVRPNHAETFPTPQDKRNVARQSLIRITNRRIDNSQ